MHEATHAVEEQKQQASPQPQSTEDPAAAKKRKASEEEEAKSNEPAPRLETTAASAVNEEQPRKKAKTVESSSSSSSDSDSDDSEQAAASSAPNETDVNMSSAAHAEPSGDCTFCCEDFSKENYVEYQAVENGPWLRSQYCRDCIETHFIGAQWSKYLENIAKADCAAALRRVLSAPPQINVKDPGLPCPDNGRNDEVFQFWYAADDAVHSAKLKDSLVGAERDAFWAEKQAFLTATELQEELTKAEAKKEAEAK